MEDGLISTRSNRLQVQNVPLAKYSSFMPHNLLCTCIRYLVLSERKIRNELIYDRGVVRFVCSHNISFNGIDLWLIFLDVKAVEIQH